MSNTDSLLNEIEAALSAVPYPAKPEGLYEPVAYMLGAGGKRVRPTLLLLAYSLYGSDLKLALPAALALETYHNHTLLHDDLMDNADVRHGRATVHRRWDANTAVLSGDVMLIMAVQHLLESTLPRQAEALQLFAQTMREVCEGQQYDVNFESRDDVGEAEYIEMIRLKTSVLLACATKMGALIGGAPLHEADLLYGFGEKVGLAFQLQDDYLDCYGDEAVFGKRIGGDILCGKKTFLLTAALARATAAQREALLGLLHAECLPDAEKIARVLALYEEIGVPALCLERIDALFTEAHQLLEALPLPDERKQPLRQFAEQMLKRKK